MSKQLFDEILATLDPLKGMTEPEQAIYWAAGQIDKLDKLAREGSARRENAKAIEVKAVQDHIKKENIKKRKHRADLEKVRGSL